MIKVTASPHYEILLSLCLYKRQTHLKYLNLPKNWVESIREKLSYKLETALSEHNDLSFEDFSVHLIDQFPNDRSFKDYLEWVSSLSAGELYDRLFPFARKDLLLPFDLERQRNQHVDLMSLWYENYYRKIEKEVNPLLFQAVERVDTKALEINPNNEVVKISRGFNISQLAYKDVLLFPSWHIRPLSLIDVFKNRIVITFPCQTSALYEDLLLKTKALGEETRLKMLAFINDEPKPFPEIVEHMRMTKGNIHHHLLLLRSAGLLEITLSDHLDSFNYQYRKDAAEELFNQLKEL